MCVSLCCALTNASTACEVYDSHSSVGHKLRSDCASPMHKLLGGKDRRTRVCKVSATSDEWVTTSATPERRQVGGQTHGWLGLAGRGPWAPTRRA